MVLPLVGEIICENREISLQNCTPDTAENRDLLKAIGVVFFKQRNISGEVLA